MALLPGSVSEVGVAVVTTADNAGLDKAQLGLAEFRASVDETAAQFDAANASMAESSIGGKGALSGLSKGGAGALGGAGLMSKLSNPYVLAGAAIVGSLTLAIKSASQFQKELTRLYTTAGETTPLKQLQQGILDVSTATGESTSQLTQALYYISSAGYTTAGGLDVLRAAAEGARAENADLVTVANALTTVMHDYGGQTSDSTKFMNQLIAAVSSGKLTLQEFSGALSTVLPTAHNVGLSFAEIGGSMATLTESGISADQATQDLVAVIRSLETPTQAEIKNLQQYGLNVVDLAHNLGKKGLVATLQEVSKAILADMGPQGLILQKTLQNATVATKDLNIMLQSMPPDLKRIAEQLMNGSISFTDYRKSIRALPEDMTSLGTQFLSVYNQANSFNQILKAGSPAAQTYQAALKGVFGQSDALNGVLALTGTNATRAAANVKKVGDAGKNTGKDIAAWKDVQNNLNQQWAQFTAKLHAGFIELGTHTLPAVTGFIKALNQLLGVLGKVIGAISDAWSWLDKMDKKMQSATSGVRSWAQNTTSSSPKLFGKIPLWATGTNYAPGGWSVVGENGPELAYLPAGAMVKTNSQSSNVSNSTSSSTTVNIGTVMLRSEQDMQTFFRQLNQDILNLGKGLTANQGRA